MNNVNPKVVIGSQEWCAIPSLDIPAIKARVDSGAQTSSLHALNIQPFKKMVSYGLALIYIHSKKTDPP